VAADTLQQLLEQGEIIQIGRQLLTASAWQTWQVQALQRVGQHHQQFPLRLGLAREALRSSLQLPPALFIPLLDQLLSQGQLAEAGTMLRLPIHTIQFSAPQQAAVERLLQQFAALGVHSPSVKESKAAVGEELYSALLDLGLLHPLNEEVVYATAEYQALLAQLQHYLQQNGTINAAQARDLLGTTRKYAIALLEHLDHLKITRRVGDVRELTSRMG
jgi:selenocysteine-specific elongation factor